MKKVSIAMLAYNHEKYARQAIESVLKQKRNFDIEIIIGEDCSTDKTREVLFQLQQEYPEIISVITREKNIGVMKNIIEVFRRCEGEYIALLECDDFWENNDKLEKIINFLDFNRDYIGAFHNFTTINGKGDIVKKDINDATDIYDFKSFDKNKNNIWTLTIVFRNFFLEKGELEKYYRSLKNLKFVADYPLKVFLAQKGKLKFFIDIFAVYRKIESSGNSWSSNNLIFQNKELIEMHNNIISFYPNEFGLISKKEIIELEYVTEYYKFRNKKFNEMRFNILMKIDFVEFIYYRIIRKITKLFR